MPSYTEEEKLQIAKRHLLPKQIAAHGLQPKTVKLTDRVMRELIEGYTREAGVRTLERTIAKVVRKSTVTMLDMDVTEVNVTSKVLHEDLGAPRYTREMPEKEPQIGVVTGLAYTTVGGETLEVECAIMPGQGLAAINGSVGRCDEGKRRGGFPLGFVRTARPLVWQMISIRTRIFTSMCPRALYPRTAPAPV